MKRPRLRLSTLVFATMFGALGSSAVAQVKGSSAYEQKGTDPYQSSKTYSGPQKQAYGPRTVLIDCKSNDYRYRQCRVGGQIESVHIQRRISDASCRRGESWGVTRGVLWVDNGCAASFKVRIIQGDARRGDDRYDNRYGDRRDDRYRDRRYDDWRYGDRRYDDRRYDDWRYDDRGYGRNRGREYNRRGEWLSISCSSWSRNRQACYIDTRFSDVRLVRRHSKASCVRGRDWGTGRNGIWVRNGCRATFSYYCPPGRGYDRRYDRYDDRRYSWYDK
ncbi:MAG: DUF3011 domain-containing protein [Pseudomonadota bacterium]